MEGPLSTRYEWDWNDWRTASDFHRSHLARRQEGIAWIVLLEKGTLLTVVVALGLSILPTKMPLEIKWLVVLGTIGTTYYAVAYLSVLVNAIQWMRYRKKLRSMANLSRSVEWDYDQERLRFRSELTEVAYRWAFFKTIVEAPRCFLFYEDKELSLWVPVKGFSSAESIRRFADLARTKVPNYVMLGECQHVGKPQQVAFDEL
jgi:hypothetical protein